MNRKKHFSPNLIAIAISALILGFSVVYLVYGSPGITTIGSDISTTNLRVSGNATTTGNHVVSGGLSVSGTSTFSGNVGIGTTSPYSKLSVWGSGTGTNRLFELTNSASTTLASFLEDGTGYFLGNIGIATTSPYAKLSVQQNAGETGFSIVSSTATNFIVDKNGYVGIGTAAPGSKLHLWGSVDDNRVQAQITNLGRGWASARLTLESASSTGELSIYPGTFGDADFANKLILMSNMNASGLTLVSRSGNITFNAPINTERMTIEGSSGNVGIGTTSPATTLDVNGIIKTQPRSSATCNTNVAGGIYFDSDDNHFYGCNGTVWVQMDN